MKRGICSFWLSILMLAGMTIISAPAQAACSNPARIPGTMMYNADHSIMQYCNGTDWVSIGQAPAGAAITALTGDVTTTGTGTLTATIPNNTVTYAKMRDISASGRLLGRSTTGAGDVEEITIGPGLTLTGNTLSSSGGGGLLVLSNMTTAARNALSSPASGMMIYNTSTKTVQLRVGTQWTDLGSLISINETPSLAFTDQTDVALSSTISSNTVTISLSSALPAIASVTGDGTPKISIAGGGWVTSGTITNGQTLQAQMTSSSSLNTTNNAVITVGAASDTWSATTLSDPCPGGYYESSMGVCWYMGTNGQSCTTVCSSRGGYNNLTQTYAGNPTGTNANCLAILTGLSAGSGSVSTSTSSTYGATGCTVYNGSNRYRFTGSTTTAAGTQASTARACACGTAANSININVTSATYGGNCSGVSTGNVTSIVAGLCNDQANCTVSIDNTTMGGDPASGCSKTFTMSYTCGSTTKTATGSEGGSTAAACP